MAALREALTGLRAQSPALGRQLEGVEIGALRSRADLARIPVLRKSDLAARQRAAPPFGGLAAIEAGPLQAAVRFARFALRAAGLRRRRLGRGAGARRRRAQSRRNRRQLLLLPPHAGRLHHGERRARARLRGDPRRARQHRADVAGDRPSQADDLLRPAGFSQDPARQGGRGRPRCLLDSQGAGFRRGAAREPARRAGAARRQDAAGLRHRRTRRDRLRDRRRRRRRGAGP